MASLSLMYEKELLQMYEKVMSMVQKLENVYMVGQHLDCI